MYAIMFINYFRLAPSTIISQLPKMRRSPWIRFCIRRYVDPKDIILTG